MELSGLLETMMGQLMSKEVLYEPLKELAEGVTIFPLLFEPYLTSAFSSLDIWRNRQPLSPLKIRRDMGISWFA